MIFRELMQHLEQRLGHYQIPLNDAACSLRELFDTCALHHDLAIALTKAIYRSNRCQSLNARLARNATLEAIAPLRLQVLRAAHTDVDTAAFIEEACAVISACFEQNLPDAERPPAARESRQSADVLPFSISRARRLKSLA